jgi:glycosyltransferase involved in cell wall biosynthesis
MQKPKVSILMTAYNHQKYIIQSINSILNQNYTNFELIIINNGSTDNTKELLRKLKPKKIKIFNLKKNIGRTKGLNYGLKKCKGKYVAIQDSDDVSKKNRILSQVNFLEQNNKVGLVGSNFCVIDEKGKITKKNTIKLDLINNPRSILFSNIIGHSTVMYKRSLIKLIKGYPKNFTYAQDYAFYLKLFTICKIEILKKNLIYIRQNHLESESIRLKKTNTIQKEHLKLFFWTLKNIETNIMEKLKIFYKSIIILITIILNFINLF